MSDRGTDRPKTRVTGRSVAEYLYKPSACGARAGARDRTKAAETPRDSPQIPPTGHTAQP